METNVADLILESESFQNSFKLCHDQQVMMNWFCTFISCDQVEITKACQSHMRRLLGYLFPLKYPSEDISYLKSLRSFTQLTSRNR